ncbi:hypothetical protein [Motiliproteus sp. MSK22-1]|uniref:hypothetical protein n=1 Tax=Motiliproteus sp. MSK22-1 TaxID=1897630 RepID=UPI000975CC75|nr:hypothetical protein [Motiliproteus sp. MSK22-1]OMH26269.1 hypothetical protein BGP75_01170 [Motiliproteus sp. MSK22-1]
MDQIAPPPFPSWWGEFIVETGQTSRWQVGPLTMTLQRLESEWQVRHRSTESENGDLNVTEVAITSDPLEDEATFCRHVVKQSKKPALIVPALADRPVVTRPLAPISLPPGQEVRLLVGTTLWMQVYAFKSGPLLLDIPIQRPSDTWFGASTRHGEVAYAARTHARLVLEEVPIRAFRAITPVKIINKGEETLRLERILLPIPSLSLFISEDGRFWTEELSIHCDEEMSSAQLRFGKGAPALALTSQRLAIPRVNSGRGVLIRALGAIFG